MKGEKKMFKELKRISVDANEIKNKLELNKIAKDARVDRSETCFAGKTTMDENKYFEGVERAKKLSKKWFQELTLSFKDGILFVVKDPMAPLLTEEPLITGLFLFSNFPTL